jgi:tRNA threonylcarbamoyladenosine biosynthesis protein TsaE
MEVDKVLDEEWVSHSVEDTFNAGINFGQRLYGGEIVLLTGQLGAGKTLFVKGIAASLGIDTDDVTSPSFTLVNRYDGRLRLYHLDLYRLDGGLLAAYAVDLDELLMDEESIIVIEWAERLKEYPLPSPVWYITITGDGEEPRRILISKD